MVSLVERNPGNFNPSDLLRVFNPDIVGFTAQTIKEARERQDLAGKRILILGAGPRGMGGAAAREVKHQGADVFVASRANEDGSPRNPAMLNFLDELDAMGGYVDWLGCDVAKLVTVTDERERKTEMFDGARVVKQVVATHGRLDGLIVASGSMQNTPSFRRVKREKLEEIDREDAKGPMFAVLAAAEQMMNQKPPGGRIAVVGSVAGIGNAFQIEYSMAKAAIHAGIRALADELEIIKSADLQKGRDPHNIQVNAIAPGLVSTPLVDPLSAEIRQAIVAKTGAERELDPAEPGAMLAFLMGSYADGINGQVIPMLGRGPIPDWLAK